MIPLYLADFGLVAAIVGIVISLSAATYSGISAYRQKKKARRFQRPEEDTRRSNVASQGAFIPVVIGRQRVGCLIGWIGDRWAKPGRRSKNTAILYQEAAWHMICVGPAKKLHAIWANGEQIFPDPNWGPAAPITNVSHPSGTTISLWRGDFTIYWGEPDQPVNTSLGDATRVGVDSRWPHVCYVHWTRYGLEFNPIWPQIEYEIEVEPYNTAVTELTSEIDQVYSSGDVENANLGYALLQILTEEYPHGINLNPSDEIDYSAGAGGGGDVELSRIHTEPTTSYTNGAHTFEGDATGTPASSDAATYDLTHSPPFYDGGGMAEETNWVGLYLVDGYESGYVDRLYVYLKGPSGQTVDLYDNALGDFYDGSDITLWTPPSGWDIDLDLSLAYAQFDVSTAVLNETGVWELWVRLEVTFDNNPNESIDATAQVTLLTQADPPSGSVVDDLVQLAADEGLAGSVIAVDGNTAASLAEDILQDMGVFMVTKCNGKLGFEAVREVNVLDAIILDEDQIVPPLPEIGVAHYDKNVDRMLFTFADKDRNYRSSVIQIDEDGQAANSGNVKGARVDLPTIVDFDVAAVVAERRSQEELAGKTAYTIHAVRGMHRVQPGKVIKVPDINPYLRVLEVQLDPTSDKAELKCSNDFYGVEGADYLLPQTTNGQTYALNPTANDIESFFEIPEHLGVYGRVLVMPVMVREGRHNIVQRVYFSDDDTLYTERSEFYGVPYGGKLDAAIAASDPYYIETGPEFSIEGQADDLTEESLDLSSDEAGWRDGKQMALIGSELFFVREIVTVDAGAGTYRLDGLLRARFDTEREAHSINDNVFVFRADDLDGVEGHEATPGASLYVKLLPQASAGPLALASATAINKTLVGKGLTPMPVAALDVVGPTLGVPAYYTGDDVDFRWAHRSSELAGTGAGMQGAGDAVGSSTIRGEFEVEVYNTGDTLVATYSGLTSTDWTYTNANIQSDLGGEVDFYILVRNVNGGWKSPSRRMDVEAL